MCSASRCVLALVLASCARDVPPSADAAVTGALRVCADPNNLPFSNDRLEGFENALATLIGSELGVPVTYTWRPQRRGFIRTTLAANQCDVVLGVPAGYERVATTRPYYRSSYVFVTRADRDLALSSLDDPRLHELRIGVHAIGDDYANVPPAQALAQRGLAARIVGFSIYGDYSTPDPPADLLRALVRGDIDVAIAWGPLAGDFARRSTTPLIVSPITDRERGMQFSIAMGTRREDSALRARLDAVIERRTDDIAALLGTYGVPLVPLPSPTPERER